MEEAAVADYIKSRQPKETPYPIDSSMSPAAQQFAQTGTQITPKTSAELDQADLMAQVSPSARMRVAGALQAKLKEQEEARKENILARADAARLAQENALEKQRMHDETLRAIAGNKQREATEKAKDKITADVEKKANAAKLASKSFDDLIFKIDQLVDKDGNPLPGFTSAFGQVDALYPNFMKVDKTSKAYKNLESIQAQETMRGLADAKEQVGQSFGSMQVKEWDRFTNLVRSLDPSQPDKSSLLPNLINLRNEALKEKEVLQSQIGSAPVAPAANPSSGQVRIVDW